MTSKQEQKYNVNNNGHYTYFCQNGNYVRVRNDEVDTIYKYKGYTCSNEDIYCVLLSHGGGSLKLCSENKKMMEEFVKVLPSNDSIKRKNQW